VRACGCPRATGRLIDGFLTFNASRAEITKIREQTNERKRRHREKLKAEEDADGTRDGTRDTSVPSDSTEELHREREREVKRERSEARGTRDQNIPRDVLTVAVEHFGTKAPRAEVERYVDVALARGYTDADIIQALGPCTWPSHLDKTLPRKETAPIVHSNVATIPRRPDCSTCGNTRFLMSEPGDDSRTSKPCPDCADPAIAAHS
jgi:hypothetical protein